MVCLALLCGIAIPAGLIRVGLAAPGGALTKLNYRTEGGTLVITFSGSDRFQYRMHEYDTPPHLLIQFFNTRNALPYNTLDVNKGNVSRIMVQQVDVNGAPATYVKVLLKKKSKYDFDIGPSGTEMTLSMQGAGSGQMSPGSLPPPIVQPGTYGMLPQPQSSGSDMQFGKALSSSGTSPYIVGPLKFVDAPLSKIIETLQEVTKVQIAVEASLMRSLSEGTPPSSQSGGLTGGGGGAGGTVGPVLFTITIQNMTLDDALDILTATNNLAWRKIGDTYAVMNKDTIMVGQESVNAGTAFMDTVDKFPIKIFHTTYIPACRAMIELQGFAMPLSASPQTQALRCDPEYNFIIAKGKPEDLARVGEILRKIDTQDKASTDTELISRVITLQYISAKDLYDSIQNLTKTTYLGSLKTVSDSNVYGDSGADMLAYNQNTKALIFVGHKLIYDRIMQIVQQLDVPMREMIVRVIPLRYMRAADLLGDQNRSYQDLLNKMMSGQGEETQKPSFMIQVDESTNAVIYTGSQDGYDRLVQLLNVLDVEAREIVTDVVTLKNMRVGDLKSKNVSGEGALDPILGAQDYGYAVFSADKSQEQTNSQRISSWTSITVIPDGNRVVITGQRQYVDKVKDFIAKIDVENNLIQTRVYKLKYIAAVRVGAALQQMIPLASGASSAGGKQIVPLGGGFYDCAQGTSDECKMNGLFTGPTVPKGEGFVDSANLSVYIESTMNALVVRGHVLDLKKVEDYISKIDVPFPQIQVDVQVVEVTKDNTQDYKSLMEAFRTKGLSSGVFGSQDSDFVSQPLSPGTQTNSSQATVDPNSSNVYEKQLGVDDGTAYFLTRSASKFIQAALKRMVTSGSARLLANPSIMLRENTLGTLDFSDTFRYTTLGFTSGGSTTQQTETLHELPIGVTLYVTAHINVEDRKILVHLNPSVTNLISVDSKGLPQTGTRTLTAESFVDDGAPIVLAGIVQSRESETNNKVPGLGDLPIVGKLFRGKHNEKHESEVIFIITPTIVNI